MAYTKKNTLISRRGYSGLSGFFDTVGDALKGALTFYGDSRAAQGAASATTAITPAGTPVVVPPAPGISTTTLVVGGAAVLGVGYLLLRKKKAA